MKIILSCLFILFLLNTKGLANQLTGLVKSTTGKPLIGVRVYSRGGNQSGALENFLTTTDENGQFKLAGHGEIVFIRAIGHQPSAKRLESGVTHIEVILEETMGAEWLIPTCPRSFAPRTYLGLDNNGYKLPIQSRNLTSKNRGSHDLVYTVHYKDSQNTEVLIYSLSWMTLGFPPEELILSSRDFSIRSFRRGDYVGIEVRGHTKDGKYWRFFGGDGMEISYRNVSKEAADYFDEIIDGICSTS
jgi:hypothetical protein